MALSKSKSLPERIADASAELKLARRDGAADWIEKAAEELDKLIDELPREVPRGADVT
jgi:hypothetical protein